MYDIDLKVKVGALCITYLVFRGTLLCLEQSVIDKKIAKNVDILS